MSLTRRDYTSDGVRTLYPVDFPLGYLRREDVYVYLDGNEPTNQLAYSWVSDTQIELDAAPANGVILHVRRIVNRNVPINDFENGAIITESNLDQSFAQTLMIQAELTDGYYTTGGDLELLTGLNIRGNKITNVGDGTEDSDAVNVGQLGDHLSAVQAVRDETGGFRDQAQTHAAAAALSDSQAQQARDVSVQVRTDVANIQRDIEADVYPRVNSFTHTTLQSAINDDNTYREYVTLGERGNPVYRKKLVGDPSAPGDFTDIAGNTFGLVVLDTVKATWLGVSHTNVDNTSQLRDALDLGAGKKVLLPAGKLIFTDTLYLQPATTLLGVGAKDMWGVTSSGDNGTILECDWLGSDKIWTDVTDPGYASWYALTDDTLSVSFVVNGSQSTLRDLTLQSGNNASDVGFFLPCVKQITMENITTDNTFNLTGLYLDATWSDRNTALRNLHENTYNRVIHTDTGLNELRFINCFLRGGAFGVFGKSSDRDPTDASSFSEWHWGWGGASDHVWINCRLGNTPKANSLMNGSLYMDWNHRDVSGVNPKFSQNRYFYGCSFRSNGGKAAVILDRTRFDNFMGCYSEHNFGMLSEVSATVVSIQSELATGVVRQATNTPTFSRVTLNITEDTLLLENPWVVGASVVISGTTYTVRGIGYNGSNMYLDIGEHVEGNTGNTCTQQATVAGSVLVCSDKTDSVICTGQSAFRGSSKSITILNG